MSDSQIHLPAVVRRLYANQGLKEEYGRASQPYAPPQSPGIAIHRPEPEQKLVTYEPRIKNNRLIPTSKPKPKSSPTPAKKSTTKPQPKPIRPRPVTQPQAIDEVPTEFLLEAIMRRLYQPFEQDLRYFL